MELKESPLKLSSVPNLNRKHRGNPLDVILLTEDGRYFYDLSDDERIELGKKEKKTLWTSSLASCCNDEAI